MRKLTKANSSKKDSIEAFACSACPCSSCVACSCPAGQPKILEQTVSQARMTNLQKGGVYHK